ncbi:MAG: hypothetical protein CMC81_02595 [Flavobacteriaceae bacterium]|nr:hypothetical protein [Flavobacteriaceae bacterium]|tara:strand:+ start:4871 stop:5356 length:486 start_codon:yes stop_codon:yes gene_type:complete
MKKIDRRSFLNDVCPAIAISMIGATFLESCSKGSDDEGINVSLNTDPANESLGFAVKDNVVEVDINHPAFAKLNSDRWMNITAQQMFLLKISESSYRAFTNSCPHQGVRNSWSYNQSENRFVCSRHGNSYPSDCTSSGTTGNVLECYTTSVTAQKLQITKP